MPNISLLDTETLHAEMRRIRELYEPLGLDVTFIFKKGEFWGYRLQPSKHQE